MVICRCCLVKAYHMPGKAGDMGFEAALAAMQPIVEMTTTACIVTIRRHAGWGLDHDGMKGKDDSML